VDFKEQRTECLRNKIELQRRALRDFGNYYAITQNIGAI
jgi:hypothetical protein